MTEENEARSEKQSVSRWVFPGMLIAAIPVFAYFLAWVHEAAFFSVFTIPWDLIMVSWSNLLNAMIYVIGFVIFFVALGGLPILLLSTPKPDRVIRLLGPVGRRIFNIAIICCFMLTLIILYTSVQEELLLILYFLIGFFVFAYFIYPQIKWRNVPGRINRYKYHDEFLKKQGSFTDLLKPYIGRSLLIAISLFVFVSLLFILGGYDAAKVQREFLVISTDKQLVVLRIYGDNLICAPLDRENKEIERKFYILEMKDIILTPEKVGPLTVSSQIQE